MTPHMHLLQRFRTVKKWVMAYYFRVFPLFSAIFIFSHLSFQIWKIVFCSNRKMGDFL